MDLRLPNLGEGADSGTVVTLFVKEGDTIAKDQPVLELENEKAVATIPSTAAGTITKIFVKVGDKISVGQRILSLSERAGAAGPSVGLARPPSPRSPQEPEPTEAPIEAEEVPHAEPLPEAKPVVAPVAAPSVRKLARDLGMDLTRVQGSERGGRIVLEDLRAYIQSLQRLAVKARQGAAPAATTAAPIKPVAEQIDFSKWGPVTKKPLSPLRQVIARRMSENWSAVPRVTQFDDADITALNELRKKYAPAYEQKGVRLTLTSFALNIVARVLKEHPIFNSS